LGYKKKERLQYLKAKYMELSFNFNIASSNEAFATFRKNIVSGFKRKTVFSFQMGWISQQDVFAHFQGP